MADPSQRDPAEGSRKTVERQLNRDNKNPEREAENPGSRSTPGVQGSGASHTREPEGQHGSTTPKGH